MAAWLLLRAGDLLVGASPLPRILPEWLLGAWGVVLGMVTTSLVLTIRGWFLKSFTAGRIFWIVVLAGTALMTAFELLLIRGLLVVRRVDGPSMYPVFAGSHWKVQCTTCGYTFREPVVTQRRATLCPLCGHLIRLTSEAIERVEPGERILIDRRATLSGPKRWQVWAIGHWDGDHRGEVKRVVGLPGERVSIIDGDVWIGPVIARKSLAEALACAVLVYDSHFTAERTTSAVTTPGSGSAPSLTAHVSSMAAPSRPAHNPTTGEPSHVPTYRVHQRRTVSGAAPRQTMHWWLFGYGSEEAIPGEPDDEQQRQPPEEMDHPSSTVPATNAVPYRDWLWECSLAVQPDADLYWCYTGPAGRFLVVVNLASGAWSLQDVQGSVLARGTAALKAGRTATWHFGFVDEQLFLSADGQIFVQYAVTSHPWKPAPPVSAPPDMETPTFEAQLPPLEQDGDAASPPGGPAATKPPLPLAPGDILAVGAPAALLRVNHIRVWRDVYYEPPSQAPGPWHAPVLGPGQYFVLGDNPAASSDSRDRGPVERSQLLGRVWLCD